MFFRAWFLGDFLLERRLLDGSWQKVEKSIWGRTYGRQLLKRLVSARARRLQRGTLLDDLWPHAKLAEKHLNDAANKLRQIVSVEGRDSLLKTFGPHNYSGYELADQSQLWVDADEALALLSEAETFGRTSSRGLVLLKDAWHYFERGSYLEGEPGQWCHARRGTFEHTAYRCQVWLAEAYTKQGQVGQAELIYRGLLEHDPSDEDVLRNLLMLFYEQGMIYEALRCYNESKQRVQQVGGAPFSPRVEQWIAHVSHQQITLYTPHAIQEKESDEEVNRRNAAKHLLTLGLSSFATPLMQLPHLLSQEELLADYAAVITTCWHQYFNGHLSEAQRLLSTLSLPSLIALTQGPGLQKQGACLASKAAQLSAVIEMHHHNLGNALASAQQGAMYGALADDPNLQIASCIQEANIYATFAWPWKELETYQRAYQLFQQQKDVTDISSLLAGRVAIGLAKSCREEGSALRFLEMAYAIYPQDPEHDPAFSYTCHTRFTLQNHTGLTYLGLGRFQAARDIFAACASGLPKMVPRRMELLIRQATISFACGSLSESCSYLEQAAALAQHLGSQLRFNEAYKLYLQLQEKWSKEQQVKALGTTYFGLPS